MRRAPFLAPDDAASILPVMRSVLMVLALASAPLSWSQMMPFWQPMGQGVAGSYFGEVSMSLDSRLRQGNGWGDDASAFNARAGYTTLFSSKPTYSWGLGVQGDYFHFGIPDGFPLPEDVYSAAVRISSNWQFAENWTLRVDARPGLYSDFRDISWDDVNAPFLVAVGYQINPDLLLMLGLNVNFRSDLATVGGPGVMWRFAEGWTLNLILPRPHVSYALTSKATVFAGGELKAGGFRVGDDFGQDFGRPDLDNDTLSYREIRVGGGLRYEITRALRLLVEGGYAVDRRWEYRRADQTFRTEDAPYFQVGLNGSF